MLVKQLLGTSVVPKATLYPFLDLSGIHWPRLQVIIYIKVNDSTDPFAGCRDLLNLASGLPPGYRRSTARKIILSSY
jgi:hypothetical protein